MGTLQLRGRAKINGNEQKTEQAISDLLAEPWAIHGPARPMNAGLPRRPTCREEKAHPPALTFGKMNVPAANVYFLFLYLVPLLRKSFGVGCSYNPVVETIVRSTTEALHPHNTALHFTNTTHVTALVSRHGKRLGRCTQ